MLIASSLSLCASATTAGIIIWSGRQRAFVFRVILFASICDAAADTARLLGALVLHSTGSPTGWFCTVQGYTLQVSETSLAAWMLAMALAAWRLVSKGGSPARIELWGHSLIWPVAAGVAVLPLARLFGGFARLSTGWCWIEGYDSEGIAARFVLVYAPVLIMLGAALILVIRVAHWWLRVSPVFSLPPGSGAELPKHASEVKCAVRQALAFPCVAAVVWVAALVNRAAEAADSQTHVTVALQALAMSSHGFINFCVFLATSGIVGDLLITRQFAL